MSPAPAPVTTRVPGVCFAVRGVTTPGGASRSSDVRRSRAAPRAAALLSSTGDGCHRVRVASAGRWPFLPYCANRAEIAVPAPAPPPFTMTCRRCSGVVPSRCRELPPSGARRIERVLGVGFRCCGSEYPSGIEPRRSCCVGGVRVTSETSPSDVSCLSWAEGAPGSLGSSRRVDGEFSRSRTRIRREGPDQSGPVGQDKSLSVCVFKCWNWLGNRRSVALLGPHNRAICRTSRDKLS